MGATMAGRRRRERIAKLSQKKALDEINPNRTMPSTEDENLTNPQPLSTEEKAEVKENLEVSAASPVDENGQTLDPSKPVKTQTQMVPMATDEHPGGMAPLIEKVQATEEEIKEAQEPKETKVIKKTTTKKKTTKKKVK